MVEKNKDKLSNKIIFSIFGILIIAFVLYHTFSSLFYPYVTEEAVKTTVKKTITANCYVVRKENIIKSNNKGFKVNSIENGNRVSKNSDVVKFYSDEADVAKANEIKKLEDFLNELEEINKQNSIYSGDLDSISTQIDSNVVNMLGSINSENFSDTNSYANKVKYYLLQSQLATGREKNYDSVIKVYKSKLNALKKGFEPNVTSVQTEKSGYFVSSVDGYENSFDYDKIDDVTVDNIENVTSKKVSSNCVGKTISENEWYITTVVNTSDVKGISKGDKLSIHTSLASAAELSVSVITINKDATSGKAALVLSCMKMNEELSNIRHKNMQIVLGSYSGLRINSKAVRIINGKKGVFVRLGSTEKFKEINIIYSSNEYVIIDSNNEGNNLKVYDDVIIKGKNLNG